MKKILTGTELFLFLSEKYSTGEKNTVKLTDYRNPCEIMPVKIFPEDQNSNGKNKAALIFHKDGDDFSILFCSSMPQNGKIDRILTEIRPSLPEGPGESSEPENKFNVSYGERNSRIPRVKRIRSSHDRFEMMARILELEITKDVTYLGYSLPCEKTRPPSPIMEAQEA
jgi:hypothetical protein